MNITLVIGLPASGKTTYAKTLKGYLVDDPKCISELPDVCEHLIITDPFLCYEHVLNNCIACLTKKYPLASINRIYFENNPDQCLINASFRKDKSVNNLINMLSKSYVPNVRYKIIPCYCERKV